jgi:hypothetical protein
MLAIISWLLMDTMLQFELREFVANVFLTVGCSIAKARAVPRTFVSCIVVPCRVGHHGSEADDDGECNIPRVSDTAQHGDAARGPESKPRCVVERAEPALP